MLSKVFTSALIGIEAYPVECEVDTARGLPNFLTVGLPDNAVKESRERVRAAIKNSGYRFPTGKVTVNLAPADIKKEGATFDLPTAVGILKNEGVIKAALEEFLVLGELSLDGSIKPVRGALSTATLAKRLAKKILLPLENSREAAIVEGVEAYGVRSLSELVEFLNGSRDIQPVSPDEGEFHCAAAYPDMSEVKGQEHAKRALMVSAAGSHNVIMIGPPGSGKTMLARRLAGILPDMEIKEAIEVTRVHSAAGVLRGAIVTERPFRAPHHTISDAGLIGGGQTPRPGEVSLAHNGVLFLDELPEFRKNVLEVLRQPLEDGFVSIARARLTIVYPSSFMLVCAMNGCPCGFLGDTQKECNCTPAMIQRYRQKLSGPLLDRIDIHLEVPRVRFMELSTERNAEGSEEIRARVNKARAIQAERFKNTGIFFNARMNSRQIKKYCAVGADSLRLLEAAIEKLGLSARAYTRILKAGRTIADLEGADRIQPSHIAEAIQYRTLDRAQA